MLVLINPTAGVDVRSKESLLGAVTDRRRAGTAVLMVSDELDDLRHCDRVLVMFHGRRRDGPAAGWTDDRVVAADRRSAAMTHSPGPAVPGCRLARMRDLTLVPAILVLLVVGAFVDPVFLPAPTSSTCCSSSLELSLLVLAEAMILIAGNFDLSLESTVGLAPALAVAAGHPGASNGLGRAGRRPLAMPLILLVGVLDRRVQRPADPKFRAVARSSSRWAC